MPNRTKIRKASKTSATSVARMKSSRKISSPLEQIYATSLAAYMQATGENAASEKATQFAENVVQACLSNKESCQEPDLIDRDAFSEHPGFYKKRRTKRQ